VYAETTIVDVSPNRAPIPHSLSGFDSSQPEPIDIDSCVEEKPDGALDLDL
jgi:hypothetical protein